MTILTNSQSPKKQLFDLYGKDGYVYAFLHIRWWHANLEKVAELIPSSGTILDLGCGYGIFSNYLGLSSDKRNVIGVELSERKLKYARKGLANVRFVNEDITRLNLPPCEAIVLLDVLHHLRSFEEQESLLKTCTDLLIPKGMLVIKDVDNKPLSKYIMAHIVDNMLYPGDRFYYRKEEDFKKLLAGLNLNVDFYQIHDGKPFPHVVYIARKN